VDRNSSKEPTHAQLQSLSAAWQNKAAAPLLDFHAVDNDAAVEFVRNRQGADPLVIWSQGLKVAQLEPSKSDAPEID
jgi:hypothetical protein